MDNKVQQLKDEITLAQSRISILMISTLAQMEADTKAREAMYTETLEDSKATISELHSQFSAVKEELDEQRKENKELFDFIIAIESIAIQERLAQCANVMFSGLAQQTS